MLAGFALARTNAKPTVVLIRADWCSACQKLEPTMMELRKQYGDKLNFVMLDVSSDEKVAESAATARRLGIGRFFQDNKEKTSTVAIFGKGNRPVFHTVANFDREAYVRAFNEAITREAR
jgi:thiol-disulfide isomerase/thioredoxin